jgi:hypothetical protein
MEVNEVMVFATGRGVDWWTTFLLAHRHGNRITEVKVTLGGALCHVECDSREHATALAATMVEHGLAPPRGESPHPAHYETAISASIPSTVHNRRQVAGSQRSKAAPTSARVRRDDPTQTPPATERTTTIRPTAGGALHRTVHCAAAGALTRRPLSNRARSP